MGSSGCSPPAAASQKGREQVCPVPHHQPLSPGPCGPPGRRQDRYFNLGNETALQALSHSVRCPLWARPWGGAWEREAGETHVVPGLVEGFLILIGNGFCATCFAADGGIPVWPCSEEGGRGQIPHLVSGDSPACGPNGSLGMGCPWGWGVPGGGVLEHLHAPL